MCLLMSCSSPKYTIRRGTPSRNRRIASGISGVLSVRQGKRFEVEIGGPADEPALEALAKLASDLLANPVIEEFTLHAG